MDKTHIIARYLENKGWLNAKEQESTITFLAAGEYNENYLIETHGEQSRHRHVFRINHGSQLGLENQISYEFGVLKNLEDSRVTPRPLFCDPSPGHQLLGKGVLLMEYLEGRPLNYAHDSAEAARIFAAIHNQPVPPVSGEHPMLVQANPIRDIADESYGLINRYDAHPREELRPLLLRYHEDILRLAESAAPLFASDKMVIVNTEVNSHNFIIGEDERGKKGWLVDWEKAVVSSRYQDLGHFLVPTTTLWKTDYRYSAEEKQTFIKAYLDHSGIDTPLSDAMRLTGLLERTILLRAMSWCYMAYYEYTREDRAIKNQDTFNTIQRYLDNMECFFTQRA